MMTEVVVVGSDRSAELQRAGNAFLAPPADSRFGGLPPSTVKIREMTNEEKQKTQFKADLPATDRFQQILAAYVVRKLIYEEAVAENPDMATHFERLLQIGDQSIVAWAQYFNSEHGISIPPECFPEHNLIRVVPYAGTEQVMDISIKHHPNAFVADLPA